MTIRELVIKLEREKKELQNKVNELTEELENISQAKLMVEKELSEVYLQKTELEKKLNTKPIEVVEVEPQVTTVVGVSDHGKDIQVESVLGSQISIDSVEKRRTRRKKVEPEE